MNKIFESLNKIPPYAQGLLLCSYFIISSPEPLLIKKLNLKLTTKSGTMNVEPGLLLVILGQIRLSLQMCFGHTNNFIPNPMQSPMTTIKRIFRREICFAWASNKSFCFDSKLLNWLVILF